MCPGGGRRGAVGLAGTPGGGRCDLLADLGLGHGVPPRYKLPPRTPRIGPAGGRMMHPDRNLAAVPVCTEPDHRNRTSELLAYGVNAGCPPKLQSGGAE